MLYNIIKLNVNSGPRSCIKGKQIHSRIDSCKWKHKFYKSFRWAGIQKKQDPFK